MNREKLLRLIEQVRAETLVEASAPVTFSNLEVRFNDRTIRFRGQTITTDKDAVVFPLLSTERMIVTKDGRVL